MATKQKILLVEHATVDDTIIVPGNMPVAILYDGATMDYRASVQIPDDISTLSSLELIVCRQVAANIYVNVSCQLMTPGSAASTSTTGFKALAVSAADDVYENIAIASTALSSLGTPAEGDVLTITIERAGGNALDTYNTDLLVAGIILNYTDTTTAVTPVSLTSYTSDTYRRSGLRNYILDADLRRLHPKLANYIWSTQTDYSVQIAEAFNMLQDDLRSRGLNPRQMMIPLDLKRAASSTDNQDWLTSSTETTSTTSTHINGRDGFIRFVVAVSAIGGSTGYSIQLQGSNDIDADDSTEPVNWVNTGTAIAPTSTGTTSTIIANQYKYYRYVHTVTGTSKSLTYCASLVETYADRWIMYKSLELICRDFARTEGDIWEKRAQHYADLYAQSLLGYKFTLDEDEDNLVDEAESDDKGSSQTTLVR